MRALVRLCEAMLLVLAAAVAAAVLVAPSTAHAETLQPGTKMLGEFSVTVPEGATAEASYSAGVLSVNGGTLTVSNAFPGHTTGDRIHIQGVVDMTLSNLSIATSGEYRSAIDISDYSDTQVTLRLEGENSLSATGRASGAIKKCHAGAGETTDAATLKITSAAGDGSLSGTLRATSSGETSSAIGAVDSSTSYGTAGDCKNVEIAGGTIIAKAEGDDAAGIGACGHGRVWNFHITGGRVEASVIGAVLPSQGGSFRDASIANSIVSCTAWRGDAPTNSIVSTDGGKTFRTYGQGTVLGEFEVPEGSTLSVPEGASLSITEGAVLTNGGTIENDGTIESASGSLRNNGLLTNNGAITGCAGLVQNAGTIENTGTITGDDGVVQNNGTLFDNATLEDRVVVGNAPLRSMVTVEGGTVNGAAGPQTVEPGSQVTLELDASAVPKGKTFSHWTVTMGSAELADASATSTTFTMPEQGSVRIRAEYTNLLATIITEEGKEVPCTTDDTPNWQALQKALDTWSNYPNSTFKLNEELEYVETSFYELALALYPIGGTLDLAQHTVPVYYIFNGSQISGASLKVVNGTIYASRRLMIEIANVTFERVKIEFGPEDSGDTVTIDANSTFVDGGDVFFGEHAKINNAGTMLVPCDESAKYQGIVSGNPVTEQHEAEAGSAILNDKNELVQLCPVDGDSWVAGIASAREQTTLDIDPVFDEIAYDGASLDAEDDLALEASYGDQDASDSVVFSYRPVVARSGEFTPGLPTAAGTYEIQAAISATIIDGVGYPNETVTTEATIAPASLTVDVDDVAVPCGTDPEAIDAQLNATVSGWVNGEGATLEGPLRDAVTFSVQDEAGDPYQADSPAGTYVIVPSIDQTVLEQLPAGMANYEVSFETGTLTVGDPEAGGSGSGAATADPDDPQGGAVQSSAMGALSKTGDPVPLVAVGVAAVAALGIAGAAARKMR